MELEEYQLVQELVGHEGDVRSLCVINDKSDSNGVVTIASGSRDRLVKLWSSNESGIEFREVNSLLEHEHWIGGLLDLSASACLFPVHGLSADMIGGFATACQDKKIRLYTKEGKLARTLTGHTAAVTSLSVTSTGELISGSWDSTAKVWDLSQPQGSECIATLDGHENGVCVLGLPNGTIATGSAGVQQGNSIQGFQIRIWSNARQIASLTHHQGGVRSLALLDRDSGTFASTSNDGSTNVYDVSGNLLRSLRNPIGPEGSPAFNFCVSPMTDGMVVVGSDDCCARVFSAATGELAQQVDHPCTVWWACQLPNGDLATAGSDGCVRVFSKLASRIAEPSTLEMYETSVKASREAIAKKQSPGVDVEKLTKIENAGPGTSEGQVKMFNKQGVAWVYQWMGASSTWVEVGEVMGDANPQELDGKVYDKVLPVEVEDPQRGGVVKLKLGFNNGDNPYMVAQQFIERHQLPETYLDDIVQFVQNNRQTSVPTLDMQSGAATSQNAGVDVDAYAYGKPSARKSSSSKTSRFSNFPLGSSKGLTFENAKISSIISKLHEFNNNSDNKNVVSPDTFELVKSLADTLSQTSRYHSTTFSSEELTALRTLLFGWSVEYLFPVLDLVRVGLIHPEFAKSFSDKTHGVELAELAVKTVQQNPQSMALVLLGTRVLVNMFRHSSSRRSVRKHLEHGPSAWEPFMVVAAHEKKTVRTSLATLVFNFANAVYHHESTTKPSQEVLSSCQQIAIKLVTEGKYDSDTTIRACMALGVLSLLGCKTDVSTLTASSNANQWDDKIKKCVDEIKQASV